MRRGTWITTGRGFLAATCLVASLATITNFARAQDYTAEGETTTADPTAVTDYPEYDTSTTDSDVTGETGATEATLSAAPSALKKDFTKISAVHYPGLADKKLYCAIVEDRPHTACIYSHPNQEDACGPVSRRDLTEEQKNEILAAHNRVRVKLASGKLASQPGAANMVKLVWDEELADLAQLWTDQCLDHPDHGRSVVKGNKTPVHTGQNYYAAHAPEGEQFNVNDAVDYWAHEVKYLHPNSIDIYDHDDNIAQYAQLVWSKTTAVGCGYIRVSGEDHMFCNYKPAGIVENEPMYIKGPPCSKCPAGFKCAKSGVLCEKPRAPASTTSL